MNFYLISQTENRFHDAFESAVVCAPDEETARNTNPRGGAMTQKDWDATCSEWCKSADAVAVKYIGEALNEIKIGVVCASYRAG
jgi:hypothetical protein